MFFHVWLIFSFAQKAGPKTQKNAPTPPQSRSRKREIGLKNALPTGYSLVQTFKKILKKKKCSWISFWWKVMNCFCTQENIVFRFLIDIFTFFLIIYFKPDGTWLSDTVGAAGTGSNIKAESESVSHKVPSPHTCRFFIRLMSSHVHQIVDVFSASSRIEHSFKSDESSE